MKPITQFVFSRRWSLVAAVAMTAMSAHAETIITIQPHTSGSGYVVTYSWKGKFATGMDSASNGSNAYIDNNTTTVSSDYVMSSGNHAGAKIRYSQHNNNGINGDLAPAPALGANPVHFDGTDGESLTPGEYMAESSHANIAFVENGGDWYNNPNDYGGVRFFGTGIQGAQSLTSWNGIDATSAFGNVQFEGQALLGQGMQFGVNGSSPGVSDSMRIGMVGDAAYWNSLNGSDSNNGLLIGYFPYATTFPNTVVPTDKFIDQFHVGTYTTATANVTMYIVNDSGHVPVLVAPPSPFDEWSGGAGFNDDTNGDGVADGLAWLLGASGPGVGVSELLPTRDNSDPDFYIFTYRRSDDAIAAGAADNVQFNSDLGGWTNAVAGEDVIITPTDDGADTGIDLVEVKIRRSLAVDGKLFVRLQALQP